MKSEKTEFEGRRGEVIVFFEGCPRFRCEGVVLLGLVP